MHISSLSHSKTRAQTTSALPLLSRHCLFGTLVLAALIFLPIARAVTPAPDGGYPGQNTAEGDYALQLATGQGIDNTGVGFQSLYGLRTGNSNTAVGSISLVSNGSANYNTAVGAAALNNNYGNSNTASGYAALALNTSGTENTAIGSEALRGSSDAGHANAVGSFNTATGARALYSNHDGGVNVAAGYKALEANVGGFYNVASGGFALGNNTSGSYNVATGANALYYNNTGGTNTATGHQALQNNISGSNNVAVGYQAGNNLTTGSNNIAIGAGVLATAGESNTTRIGKTTQKKTFIGGIYNKTVASGVGVIVNSSGQLGTVQSSARYKDDIRPMDKASEEILALKPVTFRYKEELDPDKIPQFGLIAEDVEKVDPDLVVRDENGKINTVRYEAVNAMLLNEFLKEHSRVQKDESTIAELRSASTQQKAAITHLQSTLTQQQKEINALTDRLKEQAAELQEMSPHDLGNLPQTDAAAN